MIKQLSGLPESVIGFEVTGTVTAEDFRDVVLPAVETAARSGDVRFMIVVPEFRGMTPGALWEDLKVSMENSRKWKRIALVTDIESIPPHDIPVRLDDPRRDEDLHGRRT